eukprot:1179329-Prorocentrum_minimum.AAC.1
MGCQMTGIFSRGRARLLRPKVEGSTPPSGIWPVEYGKNDLEDLIGPRAMYYWFFFRRALTAGVPGNLVFPG